MGTVWAATHTVTRRSVAIKFVRGPAHQRADLRRRFLREARAAAAVQHPNVVEVRDVFELDDETPVMVMDLLHGETLGQRIARRQQLDLTETASVLLPAVSAIGTAHERGIVHRDVKPDNIFLAKADGSEVVKVLDFGIAKLTLQDGETGVTETGSTLGTPCYMAPEQAAAEKDLDHRVDVWALGVILYECLSGARPIEGDSIGQIVMHLMTTGITPLERLVPDLPSDLTALVGRMLARERARRPNDLREVAEVLARHTNVRAPAFAAPGASLPTDDGEDSLEPAPRKVVVSADGADSRVETQRAVDTAPNAMSSTVRSAPRRRTMAVAVGLALVAAAGAWAFLRPASHPAVQAALEKPVPEARVIAPTSTAAAQPEPATATTTVTAAPQAAVAPPKDAGTTIAAPRVAPSKPTKRKAQPPASAGEKAPASSATAVAPAKPTHKGGLAETPPF
jgi:serine/threonine protein kinase